MAISRVIFHLTDRCQLDCLHCLRDPARRPLDLPLAMVERVLDEAIALHRVSHVGLTGGEPTLHPELEGVLDAIARRGLTWHLVTNGARIQHLVALLEAVPSRREALTIVDLSLDGAHAATHDAIRGPGSHREAMAAALACKARGIPFAIQMTVSARNVGEIEDLALAAAHLGAARVSVAMMQATGTDGDARLHLPASAWRTVKDRVDRLGAALQIPVTAAEGFARPSPFHVCEPWRGEPLHVDPRGRLTLCCQLSGVPGGDEEILADLAVTSLADAHRRLVDRVHVLQRERLDALQAGGLGEWDLFACNTCLRRHGKPHWVDAGSAGPLAVRARRNGR